MHNCYISSRYSRTVDEWPPYQPRHYTTLALIHHKDKCTDTTVLSVTQELAVAGKIQHKVEGLSSSGNSTSQNPNIYSNASKNISDLFVSFTASDGLTINPCIILIEGAPGIGKTVLAKEIAFQWANNELLSDKKVLLLLFLRQCNFKNMVSVESFVQYVVKSSEMATHLTKYLLQTDGKELTIVFDGYDEISDEDRKFSMVADIINRKIFAKCCLVITSRPTASSSLHSTVDCRVEIVGFTEEDRLDYIQTALQGNDDKVRALTYYLQSNPTINALCYIPLNMTILLCLAKDGIEKLPKTQTDMYKKFIEMTIVRFIQKSNINSTTIINDIANLPDPHNKVFKELAQLAYKSLKIDKIVFTLNEIEMVCPNMSTTSSNWNGLGLLKAVQYFEVGNNCVTFHFLHFSIQEYMAAWYISTLPNSKQIKLLKKTFWLQRYYNTWIMYVGITCGSSFALKHFLSGNWFQFSTKVFKTDISKKFVRKKIKCLHLFQCLVESNNEDMIASVSKFFQDNQIDLSNQTLLPSDVNTLGFFLIRSINKHWEMLNLSGCNIGSIGINILCDRFLSKESRDIVVIKTVDFSYNQLPFSSVLQIFDLMKSWHTLQLIIRDSEILQDHTYTDMYKAIEDAFFTFSYDKQVGLQLGSFLFGHKINIFPILLKAMSIKNIYLLSCTMTLPAPDHEVSFSEFLLKQNLNEIHLINTPLPNQLMKRLRSNLLTTNTNLFIYNPELSDQDADEICDSILSEKANGIMLIVSNSKIQGTINTSTINEKLTRLEIFNLAVNISKKGSDHMQTSPWKGMLYYDSNNDDLINNIFIELLHKITCNQWNWQLRIMLIEKDVLIAYKVKHECISEKTRIFKSLKAIYLSDCSFESTEYQMLSNTEATLRTFYIFNSRVGQSWLELLPFFCKEMFVHTLCDINIEKISYFNDNNSTVLVMKNKMYASNPTTKQVTLALQLQPLIDVLKLLHCQNFDQFNQIITMLTTTQDKQMKLDFMNCKFGELEFEVLQKYSRVYKKIHSTIKRLNVYSTQFTKSLISKLIETLLVCKVQQLFFYDIDQTIYRCFVTQFITTITTDVLEEVFLSITCSDSKNNMYFCNYNNWDKITKALESCLIATLYIVDCHFSLHIENLNITELRNISKLYIINSVLHENAIVNILESFLKRNLEITICNTSKHINDAALYSFITSKKLLYNSRINLVVLMKNFTCGYNTTEDQLCLLQSQHLSNLEHTIVTLVSDTKQMHERVFFVFQDKQLTALHFIEKVAPASFVTKLVAVLEGTSNLRWFGVDKYIVTSEAAKGILAIISSNKELEHLYLNAKLENADLLTTVKVLSEMLKNLRSFEITDITDQVTDYLTSIISHNVHLATFSITNGQLYNTNFIKTFKALQDVPNLQEMIFTNSNISAEVANDIPATLSFSTQLQKIDISNNCFESIMGIIKIAKSLEHISTLKKLYINSNNITDEAADDIATALFCNRQLQELDVSDNSFQTVGIIKIAKALQHTSTLKKLNISNNNITYKAADNIAAALSINVQLQELDIGKTALQAKGLIVIAKALQSTVTLSRLCISDNDVTDEAAKDIAAVLYHNTRLQELNLGFNKLGSSGTIEIMTALCKNGNLAVLQIENNKITDEAAESIAAAISSNLNLQKLNFSTNHFTIKGVITIIKALQSISKLIKLYMSNCNISNEAVDELKIALTHNTRLQELYISENNFQANSMAKIGKALQDVSTLTKLNISKSNITKEAINDMATVLSCNTQLQELDISHNVLKATGAIQISKALQGIFLLMTICISNNDITDEAADAIAAALSSNTQVKELDISYNFFQAAGTVIIMKALLGIFALKKLYINDNIITDEAANDIAATLSNCTQLQELDISNNCFQVAGIMMIKQALQDIFTLKKFNIGDSSCGVLSLIQRSQKDTMWRPINHVRTYNNTCALIQNYYVTIT